MASPLVAPYVPAGQGVHAASVAPPVEYVPGAQLPEQAADVSPALLPYLPPGHGVQAAVAAPPAE